MLHKSPAMDFDFLDGNFTVEGKRLSDPFDPDSGWLDMPATSSALLLFDGAVSIDEMWFPERGQFGMSLRLLDPVSRTWTVRWVDGRGGGLQAPVEGVWEGGRCWLTGPDEYDGRKVLCSYSWSDVTQASAQWEQCFSIDDGLTWQPNWRMTFTRADSGVEHPQESRVTSDFDFLEGEWNVHHLRATDPIAHALGRSDENEELEGTHVGRTFFAGAVSVDEAVLGRTYRRGLTFRVFEPATQRWSIYWVNSNVGRLEPPVHGQFVDGVGVFEGDEVIDGHLVRVRFRWFDITATTARWTQEFSVDGGVWDLNWMMTFTRPGAD